MRAMLLLLTAFLPLLFLVGDSPAQEKQDAITKQAAAPKQSVAPERLTDVLTPTEWIRVDASVDRALKFLAEQQQPDGSFLTRDIGQPAISSLCVLAFLSDGHQPGEGKYGQTINRAVDYVLGCQQPTGLFARLSPEDRTVRENTSRASPYNHAISGLMLCEVYGQVSRGRSAKIQQAITLALAETARLQKEPAKTDPIDNGGWRYFRPTPAGWSRSDLSVTSWQLKFLRSAKNAQFDIPNQEIESAVKYIESMFRPEVGLFYYGHLGDNDQYSSRGMMGIGALSLALAGRHHTEMARRVGDWVLAHPFDVYLATNHKYDRFHYSAYYCSNAMAQLGGEHWKKFFPVLSKTLLENQAPDGSWLSETGEDGVYGPVYPTALSVLSLTPAYQLLPIYQR